MGFWSKFFNDLKSPAPPTGLLRVTTAEYQVIWTDEQMELLKNGYKETRDHEIFPPDTVWIGHRSEVYHYDEFCTGGSSGEDAIPMLESEALRLGFRRCKKCNWHGAPVPPPGVKPAKTLRPISKAKVERVK